MNKVVSRALSFMTKQERFKYWIFLLSRSLASLLDLVGILAIGFLATSMALSITGEELSQKTITFGGISVAAINVQTLTVFVVFVLVLFAAKALISIVLTQRLAVFLARIEARAAREIAKKAFGKGVESARLNSREEITFAVQNGSPSAFNNILNSLGTIAAESFLFILVLGAFFVVNPSVAIAAVLYFGVIGVVIHIFVGGLMETTGRKVADSVVEANAGLTDLSEVIREASILGRKSYFYNKIYRSRLASSTHSATQFVLMGMPRYIIETALIVAISIFLVFEALRGDLATSAATIGVFLTGGLRLTSSLLPLQSAFLLIRQSSSPATRALDLLNLASTTPQEIDEIKQPEITHPLSVSLNKVSFTYNLSESETINNVDLKILPGSQAAFVGVSGSGKSTLADLILGQLSPTSGEVLLSGLEPLQIHEKHPGLLGYVPQKPGMISGTISQNIALGVEEGEIDENLLMQAVKDAHLEDVINNLPEGLATDIGKRKDELSGGQLQRIGLARALYSQPKLLILDEATSALDAESENEINIAINEMREKVTVILIAHRLNTIQRSDVVFLIANGKVADAGTFQELLKRNKNLRNQAALMDIQVSSPKPNE